MFRWRAASLVDEMKRREKIVARVQVCVCMCVCARACVCACGHVPVCLCVLVGAGNLSESLGQVNTAHVELTSRGSVAVLVVGDEREWAREHACAVYVYCGMCVRVCMCACARVCACATADHGQ